MSTWPQPSPPPAVPLVGRHVTLEPLHVGSDLEELIAAIARPETFALGWGGGPEAYSDDPAVMDAFLRGYLPGLRDAGLSYLVRLNDDALFDVSPSDPGRRGRCVGTTSVGEFEPAKERCHLGWTAYSREVWGTVVNPECKRLLLGHVFDHGWGRVRIQADARNDRSQRAIAGIGATFEGITRRDQRRADGSWRDAAVYSVIVDEWPAVRSRLSARVADRDAVRSAGEASLG